VLIMKQIDQKNKKILVINISLRPNSNIAWVPVGLGYIMTSMYNAGINFDLLDIEAYRYSDQEIDQHLVTNVYDIYCLGTIVTGYSKIKWITSKIREKNPNATIICGNTVASSIPEIILTKTEVDIAVMHEGDITILELIEAISHKTNLSDVKGIAYVDNNEIKFTQERPLIPDINELPLINWDLFNLDIYFPKINNGVPLPYPMPKEQIKAFIINTARGCPFQCTFCYHAFKDKKYRYRSAESIVKEMKAMNQKYGINYFMFFDELTFF